MTTSSIKTKTGQLFSRLFAGAVKLMSLLPLRVLHVLARMGAFLMAHVIRYRRKVVTGNLRRAFPEKNEREIRKIALDFYKHLADVTVETIRLLHIPEKTFLGRCQISDDGMQLLQPYIQEQRSFIGLLGHFGNWEWVPPVVSLNMPGHRVIPAYRPLKDKVFDGLMLKIRGRYAYDLVPKKVVGRAMVRYIRDGQPFIMGLISDQTPAPKTAYWTSFLSQDTPVFTGPEKLARSTNMPVVFVALRRRSRGHYLLHVELITNTPAELKEGEISRRFMSLLEKEIRRSPGDWLWSHRRWKHKRPQPDNEKPGEGEQHGS
ncbi:MAG: hypothetical protein EA394_00655 [Bacteroidia bacterium]|nr:MAG: hypothetical protein EA394_00655 [Bacteroidia bacterium]